MADLDPYKVTAYRMTAAIAEKRIRAAAANSDNVIISFHALDRMEQRDIFDVQVFEILRTGIVVENPELTEYNEWKCKVLKKLRGARAAGVITVIMQTGKLFIKTVEWEDAK
jgi:hypothetical protein